MEPPPGGCAMADAPVEAPNVRVPLTVLPARPVARRGSAWKWRAAVLIVVYGAITAHVLHWWITGRSAGRFVLSDSMRTLELGEINPGFLLFAGSLLATALVGRFMCGWMCHMGALQDLCGWLLRRAGMRPRLFRSRLLGYVPVVMALYMFVWPTVRRDVVAPLMGVAAAEFPGWSLDLSSERLWDGLPPWWVAVPFLLLCGFATVWFLGARGLCRYGCPYGGLLLPAEQLAVGRVVVDPSRCDQCGLCTAACTAGVRVHDEVRRYGAVMDRNCVRSLDCIGACPSGALRFGVGRPALAARAPADDRARRRYDLSPGEELLCAGVFMGTFLATRGLYDLVPMLVAVTIGVLSAFAAWKAWRLVRDANVRLGPAQLRLRGRITGWGWAYAAGVASWALLVAHSGLVRAAVELGGRADEGIVASMDEALAGRASPDDRASARRAAGWYGLARPLWRGGWALAPTPEAEFRLAWACLVLGDADGSEAILAELAERGQTRDAAARELASLRLARGDAGGAEAALEAAVTADERSFQSRDMLGLLWARTGRADRAEAMYRRLLEDRPRDTSARLGLGRTLVVSGRTEEGLAVLRGAVADRPGDADARRELAQALWSLGREAEAAEQIRAGMAARPARAAELRRLASRMGLWAVD
ncbi:MAG: tetratricopeptide repeat protein [Phycisphaerae bacterium]|nr:tetratricopeptide repeat protein [Phycisphaerae bacterium]